MLERLASFSFRRRRYVLAVWLLALPLTFAISGAVGGTFSNNQGGGMKSSDSQRAVDLLNKSFPEMAGQAGDRTGSIVFEVPAAAGGLEGKKTEIEAFLTAFSKNAAIGPVRAGHTRMIQPPYAPPSPVSAAPCPAGWHRCRTLSYRSQIMEDGDCSCHIQSLK